MLKFATANEFSQNVFHNSFLKIIRSKVKVNSCAASLMVVLAILEQGLVPFPNEH